MGLLRKKNDKKKQESTIMQMKKAGIKGEQIRQRLLWKHNSDRKGYENKLNRYVLGLLRF